jgi:hypothetical protein
VTLEELDTEREPGRAVLDCTSGWYAGQEWGAVRLDRILGAELHGASIVVRSLT